MCFVLSKKVTDCCLLFNLIRFEHLPSETRDDTSTFRSFILTVGLIFGLILVILRDCMGCGQRCKSAQIESYIMAELSEVQF